MICYIFGHVWKYLLEGKQCRRCPVFEKHWYR
jgi:hypothetical protein